MKKIHFNNLESKSNKIKIFILLILLIVVMLDFFELIKFSNPYIIKVVRLLLYLSLFTSHIKNLFYKNYVEWNRKGMIIKINQWLGKNIVFDHIVSAKFASDSLQIKNYSGKVLNFSLKNIEPESVLNLKQILKHNTRFVEE